jgi:hypothetical protein
LVFDTSRYGTLSVTFESVASLDHITFAAAGSEPLPKANPRAQNPSVPMRIAPPYAPVLKEI